MPRVRCEGWALRVGARREVVRGRLARRHLDLLSLRVRPGERGGEKGLKSSSRWPISQGERRPK